VAIAYGLVLALDQPPGAAEQYLISIGTVAVAAGLVGVLRRAIARLVATLADSARKDALTGLLNRRGFVDLLDVELERSRRGERPLCVLAIDVDDFKSVNDRHGTAFGDRALTHLAADLERTVRRIDAAARVAGEEFAVLLPETEPHSAFLLAERLRRRLAAAAEPVELSLSVGVACAPKHGRTPDELMLAGDRALAAAKALGGDRVVLYDPEVVASLTAGAESGDLKREESIAAVLVLAETLDIRDSGTARHSQTVSRYAAAIARELGMSEDEVERVRLAGVVHDVGKIGVADAILRKPGPLDEVEYAEMMKHAELGARILAAANLDDLSAWVHAHHERPDGRGYPRALAGEAIPLEARILAVADSYEAMTSDRVYRLAMSREDAQAELRRCAGKQFDVRVVEAFLRTAAREPLRAA
jgi:two-component system cell cycle response regulator